jgi:hypothetical protein
MCRKCHTVEQIILKPRVVFSSLSDGRAGRSGTGEKLPNRAKFLEPTGGFEAPNC